MFKQEIYETMVRDDDQFAYKEETSTTTALINCQHNWLKWLDDDADRLVCSSTYISVKYSGITQHKL